VYRLVGQQKANHHVATMCRVLGVSTSGYYGWCQRGLSERAKGDIDLTLKIRQIHQASRGTYGTPRVHAELRLEHGILCSRKRVARLMRAFRASLADGLVASLGEILPASRMMTW
jgi:putative transposase